MSLYYFRKMFIQLKKISIDKWCEGVRIKNDPGEMYVLKWVEENSKEFSEKWDRSCCKTCKFLEDCGIELKEKCNRYSEEKGDD